jgi:uncharacterized membrane protein YheB (UPF0754 family)
MAAILHCIVTDIENNRMKDHLRAWKAKTDADPLIKKIRRLSHVEADKHRFKEQAGALWECLADELEGYIIDLLIENHGEEWVQEVFKEDYEHHIEQKMRESSDSE